MSGESRERALVARFQAGDAAALDELVRRFEGLVVAIASRFYIAGGDREDLQQVARIAVWDAARSFRPEQNDSLAGYVGMIVRRKLIAELIRDRRHKTAVLNMATRSIHDANGERIEVFDLLPERDADPVERLALREQLAEIAHEIRVRLTPLEARCLLGFANGMSYAEIAERFGYRGFKHVDESITRARWKLNGGPPSKPDFGTAPVPLSVCHECGGVTRASESMCNVCAFRAAA